MSSIPDWAQDEEVSTPAEPDNSIPDWAQDDVADPIATPEIITEAPEPTPIAEPRRAEQQILATQGEFAEQPGAPLNQQPDYLVKQAIGRQPEDTWSEILIKDVKRIPERMKQVGGALVDMTGPLVDPLFRIDKEDPSVTRIASQAIWEDADKKIKELQPFVKEGSAKYYSSAIFNATADMGLSVTAGMLTRNPNIGLAIMTSQVFVDKKAESINEGKDEWRANLDATFYAATEGLTEKIPLGVLTKEGGKWLNRTLKSMGAEGLQEVFAEAMQIGYERKIWNEGEELSFGEVARRLWDAGVIGAGVGGSLAVITSPVHALQRKPDTDQSDAPPELFNPTHKGGGGQDVQVVTKDGKIVPDTYMDAQGNILRDSNAVPNSPDSNDVSMDVNATVGAVKAEIEAKRGDIVGGEMEPAKPDVATAIPAPEAAQDVISGLKVELEQPIQEVAEAPVIAPAEEVAAAQVPEEITVPAEPKKLKPMTERKAETEAIKAEIKTITDAGAAKQKEYLAKDPHAPVARVETAIA